MANTYSVSKLVAWLSEELAELRNMSVETEDLFADLETQKSSGTDMFERLQKLDLLTQSLENLSLVSKSMADNMSSEDTVSSASLHDTIKLDAMNERLGNFLSGNRDQVCRPDTAERSQPSEVELF